MSRSNRERTEQTRLALLDAARRLFVEKGYADTATPDIVAAAGVTRGALYHHFEDKKALFRAVVEQEAMVVAQSTEAHASASSSPRQALLNGTAAYLDAMAAGGRTKLLLLEAPGVLGLFDAGIIDEEHAETTLLRGLDAHLPEAAQMTGPLSVLLSAAFDRAAIAIAAGGDRREYEQAIAALLDGLADHLRR
jgi:AcrR family transcriptional regulator